MDGYNLYPHAQDFATGGQSLAVKGGVAGGLLFLLLAFIIYAFLKGRNCSMNCDMKVGDASSRPVEEDWNAETVVCVCVCVTFKDATYEVVLL